MCVSLAVGNLAAIVQTSLKRLLAYSSIAQAGFLLIPVAAGNEAGGTALLFYLIPYGAASLGAFAVVAARERELGRPVTLETMGGMGWERPLLGGGDVGLHAELRRPTAHGRLRRRSSTPSPPRGTAAGPGSSSSA